MFREESAESTKSILTAFGNVALAASGLWHSFAVLYIHIHSTACLVDVRASGQASTLNVDAHIQNRLFGGSERLRGVK
jgi:hypothetical protein